MSQHVDLRAVALSTGGAVVASTAWCSLLGRQLAQLDEAYAARDHRTTGRSARP